MRGGTRAGGFIAQPFDPDGLAFRGDPLTIADRVTSYGVYLGFASFSLSDTGVLVYDNSAVRSRLVWFDRAGKQIGTFGDPAEVFDPRISPDGQRIAYSVFEASVGRTEIWVGDLVRGVGTRLTNGPSENFLPVWSPDGARITFGSDRAHQGSAFLRSSTGAGHDEPLWEIDGQTGAEDWSPDGRSILMNQRTAESSRMPSLDVLTLPRAEDDTPRPGTGARKFFWRQPFFAGWPLGRLRE
jgi:Tol biopolymer transport system component